MDVDRECEAVLERLRVEKVQVRDADGDSDGGEGVREPGLQLRVLQVEDSEAEGVVEGVGVWDGLDDESEAEPVGVAVRDVESLALPLQESVRVFDRERVGVSVGGEGLGLGVSDWDGVREGVREALGLWHTVRDPERLLLAAVRVMEAEGEGVDAEQDAEGEDEQESVGVGVPEGDWVPLVVPVTVGLCVRLQVRLREGD